MRLKEKVAILTGSASGITKSVGLEFLEEGANVVFADIDEKELKELGKTLNVDEGRYLLCPTDLTKKKEIDSMVKSTLKKFGTVDILVNYVGDVDFKPFTEVTDESIDHGFKMILQSTIWCTQAVLPIMQKNMYGKILNTGCFGAKVGIPNGTMLCTLRHAVLGLTKALAVENGRYNLNINMICASLIKSGNTMKRMLPSFDDMEDMIRDNTPLGRLSDSKEISRLFVFLASDEAKFMTGQAVNWTGGLEMR